MFAVYNTWQILTMRQRFMTALNITEAPTEPRIVIADEAGREVGREVGRGSKKEGKEKVNGVSIKERGGKGDTVTGELKPSHTGKNIDYSLILIFFSSFAIPSP